MPSDLSHTFIRGLNEKEFAVPKWVDSCIKGLVANGLSVDEALQEIKTRSELTSAEFSEHLDGLTLQVFSNLSQLSDEISTIQKEAVTCAGRLQRLTSAVADLDSNQHRNLSVLSQIDSVKSKLETCRSILMDLQQWDSRVRDIEMLLTSSRKPALAPTLQSSAGARSTSLLQASKYYADIRRTADAIGEVPQHEHRSRTVRNLEIELKSTTSQLLSDSIKSNSHVDIKQIAQVYGRLDGAAQFLNATEEMFKSNDCITCWNDSWNCTSFSAMKREASGAQVDEGPVRTREDESILSYSEHFSRVLGERYEILCTAALSVHDSPFSSCRGPGRSTMETAALLQDVRSGSIGDLSIATPHRPVLLNPSAQDFFCRCVKTGIEVPHNDVGEFLDVVQHFPHSTDICVKLLKAYETGFSLLFSVPAIAQCEAEISEGEKVHSIWQRICSTCAVVPHNFLPIFATCVRQELLGAIQDYPKSAPVHDFSDRLLELECEVVRAFEIMKQYGVELEDLSCSLLAPTLLSALETALTGYLRRWLNTIEQFRIALRDRVLVLAGGDSSRQALPSSGKGGRKGGGGVAAGCTVSSTLTASVPFEFSSLSASASMDRLVRNSVCPNLVSSAESVWRRALNVAKHASRLNAYFLISDKYNASDCAEEDENEHLNAVKQYLDEATLHSAPPALPSILPQSMRALDEVVDATRELIVQSVAYPVEVFLMSYPSAPAWSATDSFGRPIQRPASPTDQVTSVGEFLLSLVPHLDSALGESDSSGGSPTCHQAGAMTHAAVVSELVPLVQTMYLAAVMKIRDFAVSGLSQLLLDLAYMARAIETFGGDATPLHDCAIAALDLHPDPTESEKQSVRSTDSYSEQVQYYRESLVAKTNR